MSNAFPPQDPTIKTQLPPARVAHVWLIRLTSIRTSSSVFVRVLADTIGEAIRKAEQRHPNLLVIGAERSSEILI